MWANIVVGSSDLVSTLNHSIKFLVWDMLIPALPSKNNSYIIY